jgi:hypothetical protein
VGSDNKLHRYCRTPKFSSLGDARKEAKYLLETYANNERECHLIEGAVATIYRVSRKTYHLPDYDRHFTISGTIEHSVVVNGEIRTAYRDGKRGSKWYTEVAPFIRSSFYYKGEQK